MFLTKHHFRESLDALNFIVEEEEQTPWNIQVAVGFARELFDNFDNLSQGDQEAIIEMLINDMRIEVLNPN